MSMEDRIVQSFHKTRKEEENQKTVFPFFYFIDVQSPGEKIIYASKEGYVEYTHAIAIEDGIIEHTIIMFPIEPVSTSTSTSSIPPAQLRLPQQLSSLTKPAV